MRLVLGMLVLVSTSGWAATPFKRTLDVKKNAYVADGVFTGGRVIAQGTSLLGVRRDFAPKSGLERIVVALGDKDAKPLAKGMAYFQASLDSANKRVVLDISQLKQSKISEAQVQRLFRTSPNVASIDFTLDPEDKAASMVVNLKRPMKLEVFQLRKPARIVMDLKPVAAPTGKL